MSTTIGCPIPGASQPKEPVRLIDIKEILQYDCAHFTWSGGKNCLTEQKAAYARGYDAGMKFSWTKPRKHQPSTQNPCGLRQNGLKHRMKVQTEAGKLALAVHGNPAVVVACDNSTGFVYIEEFDSVKAAIKWLRREK